MSEDSTTTSSPSQTGLNQAVSHVMSNKVLALQWLTRIGTIVFTVFAIIPFFDINFLSSYQRALLSNAATSALRLHQRLPNVRLTREFLGTLLLEDSCHYLLYSLLFIYSYPITMALQPVFLFACLHFTSYTSTLFQKMGKESLGTRLSNFVQTQQRNILMFVSLSEICIFPMIIFSVISGRGSLLTPFAYYRFLSLRYSSRRNPYTRTVFHRLRLMIDEYGNDPNRSQFIRNLCNKVVNTVSMLAPPVPNQSE